MPELMLIDPSTGYPVVDKTSGLPVGIQNASDGCSVCCNTVPCYWIFYAEWDCTLNSGAGGWVAGPYVQFAYTVGIPNFNQWNYDFAHQGCRAFWYSQTTGTVSGSITICTPPTQPTIAPTTTPPGGTHCCPFCSMDYLNSLATAYNAQISWTTDIGFPIPGDPGDISCTEVWNGANFNMAGAMAITGGYGWRGEKPAMNGSGGSQNCGDPTNPNNNAFTQVKCVALLADNTLQWQMDWGWTGPGGNGSVQTTLFSPALVASGVYAAGGGHPTPVGNYFVDIFDGPSADPFSAGTAVSVVT
jgi:hypothetical protein